MAEIRGRLIDGVKFMWDGRDYETADEAAKVKEEYEQEAFETRIVEEGDKYHVYTRRVVTEVEVEGAPPV